MTTNARWMIGIGTAAVVGATLAWAQTPATPYRPGRPIAIVGGLLIDATGAPPRHDQTVVIEGERIVEVGPMEQVQGAAPAPRSSTPPA